jgi:hypothetical protein
MGMAYSTNEGEEKCIEFVCEKARSKGTSKKAKI